MITTMKNTRKTFCRIFNKSTTKFTVKSISGTRTGQSISRRVFSYHNKIPGKSVSGRRTGRIRPNCKSKLNSESFTPKTLNKTASMIASDRNSSTEMAKHVTLKLRRNSQLQGQRDQDIRTGRPSKKECLPTNIVKKVRIVLPSQRRHRDLKSSPQAPLLKKTQSAGKCYSTSILPLQPQMKTKQISSIRKVNNNISSSSAPIVDFHTPEDDDYAINEFFHIKVTCQDIFLQVLRDPFKNMPDLIHEFHRITTKIRSVKDVIPRLKCISKAANFILDDTVLNNKNQTLKVRLENRKNFSKSLKERIISIQNSDELDVDSKMKEIGKLQEEFLSKLNPFGKSEKISLKEAIDYLFIPAFSNEDQVCSCDNCIMKEIKCLCQVIFHQINGTKYNRYLFAEFRSHLNKLKSVEDICSILKLILKAAQKIKSEPMIKIGEKANSSVMKKDIEDFKNRINILSTELKPLNNIYKQKHEEHLRRIQAEEFKRKSSQMERQRTYENFIARIESARIEKIISFLKQRKAEVQRLAETGKQEQCKYRKEECPSCPKREEQMGFINVRNATNELEENNLNFDEGELRRYEQTTMHWDTIIEALTEEKKKLTEELNSLNINQPDNLEERIALEERIKKQLKRGEEREKAEEAMWVPFPDPSELGPYKPLEWTN